MNIAYKIKQWDIAHPVGFTVIRVVLGICLLIRGLSFLYNTEPLYELIKNSSLNSLNISMPLALIITWVHILGGTLIALGLYTRICVWAQIPIVVGAIIINLRNETPLMYPALLFSVFVLVLLILFAFEGGGEISMDKYAKRHLL